MGQHDLLTRAAVQRLGPHWRGHAFLFEAKSPPGYDSSTGLRLLLIFLLLEGVIGPRWSLLRLLHLAVPPSWIRVPILLGLALMLLCFFGQLRLRQIGVYPWRDWSRTEKSEGHGKLG